MTSSYPPPLEEKKKKEELYNEYVAREITVGTTTMAQEQENNEVGMKAECLSEETAAIFWGVHRGRLDAICKFTYNEVKPDSFSKCNNFEEVCDEYKQVFRWMCESATPFLTEVQALEMFRLTFAHAETKIRDTPFIYRHLDAFRKKLFKAILNTNEISQYPKLATLKFNALWKHLGRHFAASVMYVIRTGVYEDEEH